MTRIDLPPLSERCLNRIPANHEGECRGVVSSRPNTKPTFMPRSK